MMRLPKTLPIPAPDPATPTVAAPAPMSLAADSISLFWLVVAMVLHTAGDTRVKLLKRAGEADTILEQSILMFSFI